MTDYMIGEVVFSVGLNRDNKAVVTKVKIIEFFKARDSKGNDCVTQSQMKNKANNSRRLIKSEDDAARLCEAINKKNKAN